MGAGIGSMLDRWGVPADLSSRLFDRVIDIRALYSGSPKNGIRAAVAGLLGVGIAVGVAVAQDVPIDQLAKSKVFYNIKGGQTYLIPQNSKLGVKPEAILAEDMDYDADTLIWGLQPAEPPKGLAMVGNGPYVGKNFYDSSNTGTGSVRALLVDPSTELVHYFAVMGTVLGVRHRMI